jgi:hypothetical protein
MSERSTRAAWLLGAVPAALSTCAPLAPALANPSRGPAVAVGETASRVPGAAASSLGDALASEIGALGDLQLTDEAEDARFVVGGAITRFERRNVGADVEVRCTVSLFVREARGGSVRVMLSGSAGARGARDQGRLGQVALRAAVRGALRPLSATLRRI